MDAICPVCGEAFNYKNYVKVECCSRSCAAKYRHQKTKDHICEFCGKHFQGHPNEKYCLGPHYKVCPVCGESYEVQPGISEPEYCSSKCRMINYNRQIKDNYGTDPRGSDKAKTQRAQTMIERHGAKTTWESDELRAKAQATMVERYGGKTTMESPQLASKVRQTLVSRYGVQNALQLPEAQNNMKLAMSRPGFIEHRTISRKIKNSGEYFSETTKQKMKDTFMQNYGVDNPSKSDEVQARMRRTWIAHYDVDYPIKSPEIQTKIMQTNMNRYGVPRYCMTDECIALTRNHISAINQRFTDELDRLEISYEYEFRVNQYLYDIHLIDTNILIEIDPTYTHNLVGNHWGSGLAPDYHLKKTQVASAAGYRVIHIFDWDDWSKILDMLISKTPIYARKCQVVRIPSEKGISQFLNQNHIQGTCRGQSCIYGLYYQGELVQVMTFGQPRYNKKFQYELLRLASDSRYAVVGGAERLFKAFIKDINPTSIISYCDRAKFSGGVYSRIGMTLSHNTPPAKSWSKKSNHVTDNLLRQRGYDQLFGTDFGVGTSNEALMLSTGWLPVSDCGQFVFVWNV